MKKIICCILALVIMAFVITGCQINNETTESTSTEKIIIGETDITKLNEEQIALMEKHPEFFGLDATNGLDLFVSQFSPNSYYFYLTERDKILDKMELMMVVGIYTDQMKKVLSTYDIEIEDIRIVPYQHMLSSYIGELWITMDGEDPEIKKAAYIEKVKEILFGTSENSNIIK